MVLLSNVDKSLFLIITIDQNIVPMFDQTTVTTPQSDEYSVLGL